MIAKEYVDRYKLGESFHFDRAAFVVDFMKDFDTALDAKISPDMFVKYDDFQQVVSVAKSVWNTIFKDSAVSEAHADKFWGFVYATEIIPRRNRLVPRPPRKTGWPTVDEED